ncbi:MAG: bifunctional folylpolyglutamate synthase/dihydrofolate synthase [Acidobacteriia bacterium]|nr:bifunctional folylpolyglutamate synthase/dihydrofolate synthase [Terriglobia bacterium]
MNYPDSVQFLYALGNEIKSAKLGLERIRAVLEALGNPERAFRVVHVAGTNGKGSTCAMIEAGLRAAGVRTGLFTSPHLIEPTERIQIDGIPVSPADFERAFNVVHETAEKLELDCHPTYFETVTAMAFWLFREKVVDTAVIEVGLGGRLDSTNVVEPVLTVITPIDFDHEAYLGHTIEAIASEKAGILKPGIPAVFAPQRPEAVKILDARAAELHVPVTRTEEFEIRDLHIDARGSRFSGIVCPLAGEHQEDNAVTAALALRVLGVSTDGIADARWPGRIEHVSPNPDIILDGAHNPAGARALARYLERFYGNRRIWLVYGAMRDKAIDEVAGVLFPVAAELVLTAPNTSRALRPEALAEFAGRGHIEPTVEAAIDYARTHVADEDVIVITGSLFVVGEARKLFLTTTGGRWQ